MKKKFLSIFIALVLVLSFSLVATPVAVSAAGPATFAGSTVVVLSEHLCDLNSETADAFNAEPETLVLDGVAFDAQARSQVTIEGEVSDLVLGAGWVDTAYIEIGLRPETTMNARNAGVFLIVLNAPAETQVHLQDYTGGGRSGGVIKIAKNSAFRYKITLETSGSIGGTANLEVWVGDVSQGTATLPYGYASTWEENVAGAFDEDFSSAHLFYSIIADRRGVAGETYSATVGDITIDDTLYVGPEQQFTTIQAAINFANPGDTIIVAAGTYAENVDIDKRITLQGAGSGDDPANDTIITAPLGNSIDICFPVESPAEPTLVIQDLRVADAPKDGIQVTDSGGSTDQGNIALINVVCIGDGVSYGHGVDINLNPAASAEDVVVTDCIFSNFGAFGFKVNHGGGSVSVTITGGEMSGNRAGIQVQCAEDGYGEVDHSRDVSISGVTFRDNDVGVDFGAGDIHGFNEGVVTLQNLIIEDNGIGMRFKGEGLGSWADPTPEELSAAPSISVSNVDITGSSIVGLVINKYDDLTDLSFQDKDNEFQDNDIQVKDHTELLDIEQFLVDNTFDRAVTVDHDGASLLHTIWSSIQDAIDAAVDDDTVIVADGTYLLDDQINVVTSSLTIQGAGREDTEVRRAGTPVYDEYWRVFDVSAESDVTIRDMTVGYETLLPAGGPEKTPVPGYVIAHLGGYSPTNNLKIDNVAFDGGRSAILSSGTGLVVQYCSFTGEWQRPCIRPTGADFLITWNNFQELHYKYGPVQLGGGATSGEISYNEMRNGAIPGYFSSSGAVFTVEVYTDIGPGNLVIKNNTFDGITGHTDTLNYKGNPHKTCAIYVECSTGEGKIFVQDNNTFTGYDKYAVLVYESSGIIVTSNTFTENLKGIVVWGESSTDIHVNFNDIFGNSEYGVEVDYDAPAVNALYNYWGNVTGPSHDTLNPGAQGNAVSENVDFSPWLYDTQENFVTDAPCYAGSVVLDSIATPVDTTSYAGGWNSFSTPVTLDGSADSVSELLNLTAEVRLSIVRAQRFDLASQEWVALVMGGELTGDDYQIKPGEGFFIQVEKKGSLPILCSTSPTSPPMTNLVAGWNLVGLSNFTKMDVENALYNVDYSVVISASPPNAASWSVPPDADADTNMELGEAYWLAMGQPGILFGHTTTPVADGMTWELNK